MFPTEADVLGSVTNAAFSMKNWTKHGLDPSFGGRPYPYLEDYRRLDGHPLRREMVFSHSYESVRKGIISSIKWGFPTGGRPGGPWRQFSAAFRSDLLEEMVQQFRSNRNICGSHLISRLNSAVPGVGTATTTKIAYFAGLTTADGACMIYDSMVRRAIAVSPWPEFQALRQTINSRSADLSIKQQLDTYPQYLRGLNDGAARRGVQPSQIELFLFNQGRLLPARR